MAIRNIIKEHDESDDVLHKKCRPVEEFNDKLALIIDDMIETLKEANGFGLAASQIGLLRRICVLCPDPNGDVIELVNPVITAKHGKKDGVEGCLSFPGLDALITRPEKVTVEGFDRHGKPVTVQGEGLLAVGICHEIDHLDGVTVRDRMIYNMSRAERL